MLKRNIYQRVIDLKKIEIRNSVKIFFQMKRA